MADLHCFTDDVETYIAASVVDAMALQRECLGMRESDQDPEFWEQVDDAHSISIYTDDNGQPSDASCPLITKTAAEWIASKGRGFLCSTEY